MAEDTRLKVRLPNGRVAAVEKIWGSSHCTVQRKGDNIYYLCEIDELDPIDDEEYRKGK